MFWVFAIRSNIKRWMSLKILVAIQPCSIPKIVNSNRMLSHLTRQVWKSTPKLLAQSEAEKLRVKERNVVLDDVLVDQLIKINSFTYRGNRRRPPTRRMC